MAINYMEKPIIFVACRWANKYQKVNNYIKNLIKKSKMTVSGKMEKTGIVPLTLKETINIMDANGFCVIFIPEDGNMTTDEVKHEINTAKIYQLPAFMFVEQKETGRPEVVGALRAYQGELNCVGEWFEFKTSDLLAGKYDDRISAYLNDVRTFVIKEYSKIQPNIESAIAAQWTLLSDMQPFHTGLIEICNAYDKQPTVLYNAAAKAAAKITGAEFGFIGMLEPREEWMEVIVNGFYGSIESKNEQILQDLKHIKLGYKYRGDTFGLTGHVAKMGIPIREGHLQSDMQKLKEAGKNFVDPGNIKVQSELCVPIEIKGRIIGVIDVESVFENQFQRVHQNVLEWLSKILAIAYSGEQLESFIGDLSKPSIDRKDFADRILRTLMKWAQADFGFIAISRDGKYCVETITENGLKLEVKEQFEKDCLEIKHNIGLSGRTLLSGEAIYSENPEKESGYLDWFKPVNAEIVLPIKSNRGKTKTIGVVDLEFIQSQNFKDIDKILFENIANILSIVFEVD